VPRRQQEADLHVSTAPAQRRDPRQRDCRLADGVDPMCAPPPSVHHFRRDVRYLTTIDQLVGTSWAACPAPAAEVDGDDLGSHGFGDHHARQPDPAAAVTATTARAAPGRG